MTDAERDERVATALFTVAIRDGQAAELLTCLFEGGSATVDLHTGKLVMLSNEQLRGMFK